MSALYSHHCLLHIHICTYSTVFASLYGFSTIFQRFLPFSFKLTVFTAFISVPGYHGITVIRRRTCALTCNVRPSDVLTCSRYLPVLAVRRQYYARNERKIVRRRTGLSWRVSRNGNERRKYHEYKSEKGRKRRKNVKKKCKLVAGREYNRYIVSSHSLALSLSCIHIHIKHCHCHCLCLCLCHCLCRINM
jgi:hypothetical protein